MNLLTKPRKQKIKNVASGAGKLTNAAIAGGGTGALVGLIAKPTGKTAGTFQRKVALGGAALYAGASAAKSLMKRKKKM